MQRTAFALLLALSSAGRLAFATDPPAPVKPAEQRKPLSDAQFIELQTAQINLSNAQTAMAQAQSLCEAQPQTEQAKIQLQIAQQRWQQTLQKISADCGGRLDNGTDRPVCVITPSPPSPAATPPKPAEKK